MLFKMFLILFSYKRFACTKGKKKRVNFLIIYMILLKLVRWPSLLWLVNSSLIGQMAQSVVTGQFFSDWSDGPVCCDWSTLLW